MADRRDNVPFDSRYFEKKEQQKKFSDIRSRFIEIFEQNHWAGKESISGEGSGSAQTQKLKTKLPPLLEALQVNTLLDLPCGDLSWIREINLPVSNYIGADIVPDLVEQNRAKFSGASNTNRQFLVLDLTGDPLPDADLILCRDCLVHLSFTDIDKVLRNLKESSIKWLLATTFTDCEQNEDIATGDWRVLNLELPPFNFSPPNTLIDEECTEGGGQFTDKSLGLWKIQELPDM